VLRTKIVVRDETTSIDAATSEAPSDVINRGAGSRKAFPWRFSSRAFSRSRRHYANGRQRGMIVTLTVALLLSIGLLLFLGSFEMARATWLLSQSY
jgi:hypothetical protein